MKDTKSFTRSLYIEDVYCLCEKVFKIKPLTELAVCQKGDREAHYYVFGVKNAEIWNRLQLERYVGERILLTSGRLVYISYAFEEYSDITVKHIPPHWGVDHIERIFSAYGKVAGMKHEPMKFIYRNLKADYEKVWNGNWRIRMQVEKSIPSNMIVSGFKIEVFYKDQPKTCYRCGQDGHIWSECETRYKDFENRFSLADFPALVTKEPMVVRDETEENVDENMHEEVSETPVETVRGDTKDSESVQKRSEEDSVHEIAKETEAANVLLSLSVQKEKEERDRVVQQESKEMVEKSDKETESKEVMTAIAEEAKEDEEDVNKITEAPLEIQANN